MVFVGRKREEGETRAQALRRDAQVYTRVQHARAVDKPKRVLGSTVCGS